MKQIVKDTWEQKFCKNQDSMEFDFWIYLEA